MRPRGPNGGSDSEKLAHAHAQAEVAEVLREGLKSGDVQIVETVDEKTTAPEAQVFGVDLWEALCWRRGSFRYYRICSAIKVPPPHAHVDRSPATGGLLHHGWPCVTRGLSSPACCTG